MIVCHPLKIIFVKTKKVAGTSFEIALSNYCSDDCIITPIGEEKYRHELGIRGSQNFGPKRRFWNHLSAKTIKSRLPGDIWNSYRKISICRNPYDIVASFFFFRIGVTTKQNRQTAVFEKKDIAHGIKVIRQNLEIAPHNLIDTFIRYEHFEEDIEKLNIPGFYDLFKTINAKSEYRPREYDLDFFKEKYPYFVPEVKNKAKEYIELFDYGDFL